MIAFFKQYGHNVQIIHSDHENTILSAQTFLNQQGIQLKTIAPYQHEQRLERYVQTINCRFRSVLSSMKYKLPNKLYAQLFTAVHQMINNVPNSVHPTLTPSIIFKGTKIDLNFQKLVPFGTYASLHYAKRVDNKYQPHTENGILLYLTDDTTSNMTAWIPGRNTVVVINKYTVIKASPSDYGFQSNTNIIPSHIPDFLTLSSQAQEGATLKSHQSLQCNDMAIVSTKEGDLNVVPDNIYNNDLDDIEPIYQYDNDHNTYSNEENLLTLPDDVPYLRRSIRQLRYHQPIDAVALKTSSGISVKKALLINEKKAITAIMDEVKNMLDYKVGHYVKDEDCYHHR
jgi:hypothetical protein